jgi:hypothetical protein
MTFKPKSRVRITAKDRRLLNSLDVFTAKAGLYRKDISLDSQYSCIGANSDSLLDIVPQTFVKNAYDDLSENDLPELIKKVRRLLISEILSRGKRGKRLLKYYLTLFDKMMEGKPFSYVELADRLHMSRMRLELLRDGLLKMPPMECLITILKKSDAG